MSPGRMIEKIPLFSMSDPNLINDPSEEIWCMAYLGDIGVMFFPVFLNSILI